MEAIRQGDIPGVQLRRRKVVAGCSPAELWPWLVEPERLARWFADRAEAEPGPPAGFLFETGETPESPRVEIAEIVEQERPHRLVLALRQLDAGWTSATVVTLSLLASGDDCELDVLQEGFQHLPLSIGLTAWERSRSRWESSLGTLVELAVRRPA